MPYETGIFLKKNIITGKTYIWIIIIRRSLVRNTNWKIFVWILLDFVSLYKSIDTVSIISSPSVDIALASKTIIIIFVILHVGELISRLENLKGMQDSK